ncbi:hypothetical protein AAFF_G00239470 [Aldrovandia affinis]|uniref:Transmembrane protein 125 n=1 Tax=Aldrovandia affinis TaxID=143900 RepID=A0AAD7REG7_9TELE|nr:hypothetical protein AAFF_G00239470 [Aldrovandia affinis]
MQSYVASLPCKTPSFGRWDRGALAGVVEEEAAATAPIVSGEWRSKAGGYNNCDGIGSAAKTVPHPPRVSPQSPQVMKTRGALSLEGDGVGLRLCLDFGRKRRLFTLTGVHLDVTAVTRVLDEQVELWWFREPRKSLACYCVSVALVLACGAGGVGVLSTTTSSASGAWRLAVGVALCLLALAVLLKQLLSSAVQDMGCVRSWGRIRALKSGGPSDHAVLLLTGVALLLCGSALLGLAPPRPAPGSAPDDMAVTGAVLLAGGGVTVLGVAGYSAAAFLLERTGSGRRLRDRAAAIFTISGRMSEAGRESTSSMVNLL